MDSFNFLMLIADCWKAVRRLYEIEKPVKELVGDDAWLVGPFIATVQQRGAAIIKARKLSSPLSTASSACDHICDWVLGTPKGTFVSMGVYSDGSYNVPAGLIYSFPVTCESGEWKMVQRKFQTNMLFIISLKHTFNVLLSRTKRTP
ncbi:malate dehydrogenase [Ranunculus cassubicifolius]